MKRKNISASKIMFLGFILFLFALNMLVPAVELHEPVEIWKYPNRRKTLLHKIDNNITCICSADNTKKRGCVCTHFYG
ncbi:MAG: hypothetical protein WC614_10860 [bacterium]